MNQLKIYAVDDLKAKLAEAKAVALIDYQGLTANQFASLRQRVRQSGGQIQVVKNRLLMRALRGLGIALNQPLTGQTAVVWSVDMQIGPLQEVRKAAKEWEKLQFKWGIYQGQFLPHGDLVRLVDLPDKQMIYAQLVAGLANSMQRFLYGLSFPQRQLVLVLKAAAGKEQEN